MRDLCPVFQEAQAIKPHLKKCPVRDYEMIRPLSGHGGKVCAPCRKKNRDEQRKRENAQKRARRAKLKRDKMTAGIGAGNVVWTPPNTWAPSVVDAHTLALHSPQPQRFNTFKVRSMTQALQYELNGSISTETITHDHTNVSQDERGIYSQSRQIFAATMSDALQPQKNGHDMLATGIPEDNNLSSQHEDKTQDLTKTMIDDPEHQPQKHEQVGLGITIPNDAKWGESHAEPCSFSEWSFRMELNEWSTVFEDNGDSDDAKEL